jgi:DNA polymerase-3 subunit alpha
VKNADTLHMMGREEMKEKFKKYHYDLPEKVIENALLESGKISETIEEFSLDKKLKIPKLYDTEDKSRWQLEEWCREGMRRIGKDDDPVYQERLEYELETIFDMGLEDYFVLAAKVVRWARDKGIRISSGRGSAAASIVCYLTKITMIDPIAHKFKFERFLNKNRKGMPDIDLDFDPERIPEVIEYLENLLGKDQVCHISAVGTYKSRSAIKDVARVLNVPYDEVNRVTATIPEAPNMPDLDELYKDYEEVRDFLDNYPEVKKHAFKIEGMKKQLSRHAAGILVSPFPITNQMPIMRGKESMVTAFTDTAGAEWVTGLGWMKLDILSIDGLTKQGKIIESVYKRTGVKIDLDSLPVATDPEAADPKVLEVLCSGRNEGIWQFRSKGASNFVKQIHPDNFYQIAVANALYRPGALDGGDAFRYIDLKKGKIKPTYWHPSVKPILESTLGVVAFQEQLMEVAEQLGGYSPEDADDLRKVVSKLYRLGKEEAQRVMNENKPKFVKGCMKNGLTEEEADLIWERFLAFSGYGFNYIHAASYGFTAYQDAYLKAYYPMDFYAAHLSGSDEVASLVREARFSDILVSPPDVNLSEEEFTIDEENNKILYGLRAVKYIGGEAVKTIVKNRTLEGEYKDTADFRNKIPPKKVNKRGIEYLVKAGAFDSLGERENLTKQEKRELEAEAIGVELTGSEDSLKYAHILETRIKSEYQVEEAPTDSGLTVGGEITNVKIIEIKRGKYKGSPMAFIDLSYKMDSYSCTVFTDKYYKYKDLLSEGNIVIVRGRKSDRGGLILDTMARLEDLAKALEKQNG